MKCTTKKRKPRKIKDKFGNGYYEWILVKVVSFEKELVFRTQWKYRVAAIVSDNSYYFGKLSETWWFGSDNKLKTGEELKLRVHFS